MSNAAKLSAGIFASLGTLLIIIGLILTMNTQPATADDMLSLGERYLLELQFEQALVQFLAVIEIEPMNVRAYLGAADAYVGLGQRDSATNLLRLGLERTNDELIRLRLTELEGTAQAPGSDDENMYTPSIGLEDAESITTDNTNRVNLTGMPPMSFQEIADWGWVWGETTLHEIAPRVGMSIETVDENIVSARLRQQNHVVASGEFRPVTLQTDNIYTLTLTSITTRIDFTRFSAGMSFYDAVSAIAVFSPELMSVAENPTRENFLLQADYADHSFITDDVDIDRRSINIFDSQAIADDGTVQSLVIQYSYLTPYLDSRVVISIHLENNGRSFGIFLSFRDLRLYQIGVRT